jgi:hypothetical protein
LELLLLNNQNWPGGRLTTHPKPIRPNFPANFGFHPNHQPGISSISQAQLDRQRTQSSCDPSPAWKIQVRA